MPLTATSLGNKSAQSLRPVRDEWGVYDPEQAGMPATLRVVNDNSDPAAFETSMDSVPKESEVFEEVPAVGALYTVESPLRCPQCRSAIRTFRALRVLRTQVPFMSTLPRKGYVLVCPECAGLLSAELSGLL